MTTAATEATLELDVFGVLVIPRSRLGRLLSLPSRGLSRVQDCLQPLFNESRLRSTYCGTGKVALTSHLAELESEPMGGDEHLLNGHVRASQQEGVNFVVSVSTALHTAGFKHQLEIYDPRDRSQPLWQSPMEWRPESTDR